MNKKHLLILSFVVFIFSSSFSQKFQFYFSGGYTFTRAPLKDFNEFIGLYNEDPNKIGNYVFTHGFKELKCLNGLFLGGGVNYMNKLIVELNYTSKFNHTFSYYDPATNPTYLRVDLGFGINTTEFAFLVPIQYKKFVLYPGIGLGFLNRKQYYWDDEVLQRAPKKKEMSVEESKKSISLSPMIQIGFSPFKNIPLEFSARTYYQAMFSSMSVSWLSTFKGYWTTEEAADKKVTGGNLGITFAVTYHLPDLSKIKLPERKPKQEVVVEVKQNPVIKGNVRDIVTGQPLDAVLTFYIDNKPVASLVTENGSYILNPASYANYTVEAKAFGYQTKTSTVEVNPNSENPLLFNIKLAKVPSGQAVKLENILFEKSSDKLLEESFVELNKLVKFMSANLSVEIEVAGHTSSDGNDDYNLKLSQDRAQSVSNYLISKGISKSRIISKGYGETKPIASNETEDGKKLNRRVEFKILKQ